MAHTVIDANDVEASHGVFRGLSAPLGVGKFKVNRLELPPGGEGPEHDHVANGEEEVYAVVAGSGTLIVDGEGDRSPPGSVRVLLTGCAAPDARRRGRAHVDRDRRNRLR